MDVILVGDSATNVMAGNATTLPMTLDEMIYHSRCVARATRRALVVADMPFGYYQGDSNAALHNAVRLMKESGCEALKLEGGAEIRESIEKILSAGSSAAAVSDSPARSASARPIQTSLFFIKNHPSVSFGTNL